MVFLWFSYGFPMVFLWFSYGFPMETTGNHRNSWFRWSRFRSSPQISHPQWLQSVHSPHSQSSAGRNVRIPTRTRHDEGQGHWSYMPYLRWVDLVFLVKFIWYIFGDSLSFIYINVYIYIYVSWCTLLVMTNIANWKDPCLMGQLTISTGPSSIAIG